jgi:hypothetical protein
VATQVITGVAVTGVAAQVITGVAAKAQVEGPPVLGIPGATALIGTQTGRGGGAAGGGKKEKNYQSNTHIRRVSEGYQVGIRGVSERYRGGLSEGYQRGIRGVSEGYQRGGVPYGYHRGIRWVSEGYQRGIRGGIRGVSDGYQRGIRGVSERYHMGVYVTSGGTLVLSIGWDGMRVQTGIIMIIRGVS